jgi:methylmalonyl-CoA/ethylmalonyl-CoA epimerase
LSQILGINHIGLAPKDPAQARWFFEVALGLAVLGEELVQAQETMTVMLRSSVAATFPEPRLEIVSPEGGVASSKGPIAKFLEKKGSGIHHVALNVTGLDELLARLKSLNVRLIDAVPRPGAHETRIAFVHPESTGGLLVELVEETVN